MPNQLYISSFTQRKIAAGLLSLALLGATQLSHAAPITLQNTVGTWTTYTLAPDALWDGGTYASSLVQAVNYPGTNGAIKNGLYWGESNTGGNKSGLLFDPTSNGSAVTLGTAFKLGELTHYNNSIYLDTAITNANLKLQLSLAGTGSITTGPLNYSFNIFETPNVAGSCPSWQASTTPCDDKISFSASSTSQQFSLDGQLYSFNLLGFFKDPSTIVSDMITTEQMATTRNLMASITAVPSTVTATPVPAPAALWLLGSGLLGLAGFAKRKRITQ